MHQGGVKSKVENRKFLKSIVWGIQIENPKLKWWSKHFKTFGNHFLLANNHPSLWWTNNLLFLAAQFVPTWCTCRKHQIIWFLCVLDILWSRSTSKVDCQSKHPSSYFNRKDLHPNPSESGKVYRYLSLYHGLKSLYQCCCRPMVFSINIVCGYRQYWPILYG